MVKKGKEWFIKIAVQYYKDRFFMETIEACERALAIDPNYITPYYGIAKSLVNLHKFQEALEVYNKALRIKETKELYIQRGHLYFKLLDYISASNDYYRALALDPDAPKYKYYDALKVHDKALEVKDVKELYAQRGDLYFLLKDYVNASNDYYRALALDPKDEELMKKKAKANEYVDYMPYPSRHEDWTVIDIDELGYSLIEWDYEQEEMDDRLALYWQDAEYYMANGLVEP